MNLDEEDQRLYPDTFYCPISGTVMEDPVVLPDGESYERAAVVEALLFAGGDNDYGDDGNFGDDKQRSGIESSVALANAKLPPSTALDDFKQTLRSSEKYEELRKYFAEQKSKKTEKKNNDTSNKSEGRRNQKRRNDDEESDGENYEELMKGLCRHLMYENRSLRAIIEKEVSIVEQKEKRKKAATEAEAFNFTDSVRQIEKSMREKLNHWLSELQLPFGGSSHASIDNELHNEYYCFITSEIMSLPVIDAEGHTYEKIAIETWMKRNDLTSPLTRTELPPIDKLYKNAAIAKLLKEERERPVETMHPSIWRWVSEVNIADLEAQYENQGASAASEEGGGFCCCCCTLVSIFVCLLAIFYWIPWYLKLCFIVFMIIQCLVCSCGYLANS